MLGSRPTDAAYTPEDIHGTGIQVVCFAIVSSFARYNTPMPSERDKAKRWRISVIALRFNLRELFAITGVIAFATVSLVRSDQLFETLFFSFTLLVILTALLLIIGLRARARVFWIAFAATSSLYLGLAHVPDSEGVVPRHYGPEITTQLLLLVLNWPETDETSFSETGGVFSVQDDPFATNNSPPTMSDKPRDFDDLISDITEIIGPDIEPFPPGFSLMRGGGQRIVSTGTSVSFMRIGHSAWALLIGWLAGHFTRLIYARSRREPCAV